MNSFPHGVTLQINLSPGDVHYAHITVPALIKAHRSRVDETVAIEFTCLGNVRGCSIHFVAKFQLKFFEILTEKP